MASREQHYILQQYMAENADGSQSRSLPNSSSGGWANTLPISPDKQSIAVISYNGIFSLSLKAGRVSSLWRK